jgi:hypothetical protein
VLFLEGTAEIKYISAGKEQWTEKVLIKPGDSLVFKNLIGETEMTGTYS